MISHLVYWRANVVSTEAVLKYVLAFLVIVSGFLSNLVLAAFKAYLNSVSAKEAQLAKREECNDKRSEDRFRNIEDSLREGGIPVKRRNY